MRRIWLLGLLTAAACDGRLTFSQDEIDRARLGEGLRPGFLLGAATSSHQVEGGNTNDWTLWESTTFPDGRPHIEDGSVSGRAADSWNRFDEDLARLVELGANAYRLSVEWSRLEPTRGSFDDAVALRYLDMVTRLRAAGIEPMVTLYHFTLPLWVADQGGWENPVTLGDFQAFVGRVATRLGAQVDLWCTVNEPNVVALEGYLTGRYPPGKQNVRTAVEVFARLIEAHALAAQQIRALDTTDADGDGRATVVGLAHHVRVLQPASYSTLDTTVTAMSDDLFNEAVPRAAATGRIQASFFPDVAIDRAVEGLQGSFDYLGLNYYTRDYIRTDLTSASLSNQYVPPGRPVNDLGWDIYPEGLYMLLSRFAHYGWPIYVTENGIADRAGAARPGYLRSHFYALQLAARRGVDVRGYFHWSLIDNFEWAEGYTGRFGLYSIDFDNDPLLTRTPTEAVAAFQDIARNLGLTPGP